MAVLPQIRVEDFEPFFACDEGIDFDRHLELNYHLI